MNRHPAIMVAAVALVAAAACVDITRPQTPITTHTLLAVTEITATDSLQCIVFASLPLPDSIQAPWHGTASVSVRRYRKTSTVPVQSDTTATAATFDITRGTGDSLNVAIHGAFAVVFAGRLTSSPYEASGSWRCDDSVPLSSSAPGQASGVWTLSTDRFID